MESVKTIIVSQARCGSTRLPKKVLLKIQGQELLSIHLDRLKQCALADEIIVATTINPEDEVIETLAKAKGVSVSRGSVDDVLERFYFAVKDLNADWVVRVTSDCPLLDPKLVDAVIAMAQVNDVDYAANILVENFPDGQDVEVFKFSALEKAYNEASLKSEREHVTPYIRKNSTHNGGTLFQSINFPCAYEYSNIRMTVDEAKDFELMTALITELGAKKSWLAYTKHIIGNQLNKINSDIVRNEGMLKSLKND